MLFYIDDILIASKHKSEIEKLKDLLNKVFEIKNPSNAKKVLSKEIFRNIAAATFYLSEERYIKKVLKRFDMQDCKLILTPLGL